MNIYMYIYIYTSKISWVLVICETAHASPWHEASELACVSMCNTPILAASHSQLERLWRLSLLDHPAHNKTQLKRSLQCCRAPIASTSAISFAFGSEIVISSKRMMNPSYFLSHYKFQLIDSRENFRYRWVRSCLINLS